MQKRRKKKNQRHVKEKEKKYYIHSRSKKIDVSKKKYKAY